MSSIPATLVAGDGWAWADACAFAAHPAPEWGLRYVFRPVTGGAGFVVAAIWANDTFQLSEIAAITAGRAPGDYTWTAIAEHDATGDRQTVASGRVTIRPDPLALVAADIRSAAERILSAIEATIQGRVVKDADSYSIEGRSISRTPVIDLIRLRNLYAAEVARERNPAGSGFAVRRMGM